MAENISGKILSFSQGEGDDLHYCIVEYRGLDPYELVRDSLVDLGIVFLCLDGDKLRGKNRIKYQEILNKANIPATLVRGNLWIGNEDAPIYFNGKPPIIQGNEFIFSAMAPIKEISSITNPLKGWNKNKLKEKVIAVLKATLKDGDVYVYDDFTECLFVSKKKDAIESIESKIKLLRSMKNANSA
jgi:hypothetical protein